jgi:hypothetical protein
MILRRDYIHYKIYLHIILISGLLRRLVMKVAWVVIARIQLMNQTAENDGGCPERAESIAYGNAIR